MIFFFGGFCNQSGGKQTQICNFTSVLQICMGRDLIKCCFGPLIGWKVPATAGDWIESSTLLNFENYGRRLLRTVAHLRQSPTCDSRPLATVAHLRQSPTCDSRPLATVASWSINTRATVSSWRRAARLSATVGDWSINQAQFSITMFINSWRPSDAFMRQYNMPALVKILACRLPGTKPLSESMLPYC